MNARLADRYRVGHVFLIVTPLIFIRRRGFSISHVPSLWEPQLQIIDSN
jgi:hypothetical protein